MGHKTRATPSSAAPAAAGHCEFSPVRGRAPPGAGAGVPAPPVPVWFDATDAEQASTSSLPLPAVGPAVCLAYQTRSDESGVRLLAKAMLAAPSGPTTTWK